MRRLALPAAFIALGAAAVGAAAPAGAQPAGLGASPYTVTLEGPEPTTGLGASIPVRIATAPGAALTEGVGDPARVRVRGARLVSPAGAALPVQPPPMGAAQAGVYPFRGDLPTPGAWTLSFTVLRPNARPAPVSLSFTVAPTPTRPLTAEPAQAAVVAPDPGFAPAQPAVTAPGPAAPAAPPPR